MTEFKVFDDVEINKSFAIKNISTKEAFNNYSKKLKQPYKIQQYYKNNKNIIDSSGPNAFVEAIKIA